MSRSSRGRSKTVAASASERLTAVESKHVAAANAVASGEVHTVGGISLTTRDTSAAKNGKHGKSVLRPDHVEVRIDDVVVHRTPPAGARSLRYLLASEEMPTRLGVTSSLHGEGVTSISRSIAALIAFDWRVSTCWVDLNWWKADVPQHESMLFDTTIAQVVEGVANAADLAVPTSIPGLSMVAAGQVPTSSRARLSKSEALSRIVADLSRQFDYVVFDLPPVLTSSDAVTLAGLVDAFLLVVRHRSTSSVQVRASLQTLAPTPCFGTVLNNARSHVPRWMRTSNEVWALGT